MIQIQYKNISRILGFKSIRHYKQFILLDQIKNYVSIDIYLYLLDKNV